MSKSFLFSFLAVATIFSFVVESAPFDNIFDSDSQTSAVGSNIFKATTRIVDGTNSEANDHPYFAELNGCGGTVVASDIVLFAAHCKGLNWRREVFIGGIKTQQGESRYCDTIRSDEMYDRKSIDYDFALCKLSRPIHGFNTGNVKLVMNEQENFPSAGDELVVMGYGLEEHKKGGMTQNLKQVDVNYIDNRDCKKVYGKGFTDRMLCAGTPGAGEDACNGDSGGPLVHRRIMDDGSIEDTHVGVVSWGVGCAWKGFPGVYARTSSRHEWIQEKMCTELKSVDPICDSYRSRSLCPGQARVTIRFNHDDWAIDTSFSIKNNRDEELMSRWYWQINKRTTTEQDICLDYDSSYELKIHDNYPAGDCGSGPYQVLVDGSMIIDNNGLDFVYRYHTIETGPAPPVSVSVSVLETESISEAIVAAIEITEEPTLEPTNNPTAEPTAEPSKSPSGSPSSRPTVESSGSPTESSASPSGSPSGSPTVLFSSSPTIVHSGSPSSTVTGSRSPSKTPTREPTTEPSASPSESPTVTSSGSPTGSPTKAPTREPTTEPSASPSESPTVTSSGSPTGSPTKAPTREPTTEPSASPSESPTVTSSGSPSGSPTKAPTREPTTEPSASPTRTSTEMPTAEPTTEPSATPTALPTAKPTASPTGSCTDDETFRYKNKSCDQHYQKLKKYIVKWNGEKKIKKKLCDKYGAWKKIDGKWVQGEQIKHRGCRETCSKLLGLGADECFELRTMEIETEMNQDGDNPAFRWNDNEDKTCKKWLMKRNGANLEKKCKKSYQGLSIQNHWCPGTCNSVSSSNVVFDERANNSAPTQAPTKTARSKTAKNEKYRSR